MYVQVNIGRNINNEPMPSPQWAGFQNDVRVALAATTNTRHTPVTENIAIQCETHYGTGVWNENNEESAHISLYWEHGFNRVMLRDLLRVIRTNHGQDAVALIIGSELI